MCRILGAGQREQISVSKSLCKVVGNYYNMSYGFEYNEEK